MMDALIFKIEDELYAIDINDLDEILMMVSIQKISSLPYFLSGIFNLRGELIPVMDLRPKLGHNSEYLTNYPIDTRIIIVTITDKKIGIIVQGLKEIKKVTQEKSKPNVVNETSLPPYLNGMALYEDNKTVQIIHIKKILNEDELSMIETETSKRK
ncbi:MAG: chemotaxis protein CheW [Desulfobacterales bacterium]|nr:chemotaxis protein CheW [Desulfobacterales bacterium]